MLCTDRCGATKTIALGFPMIAVLFGSQPNVGLLSLPLLIYHPSQIVIGSFFIRPLKAWVERAPPPSAPSPADPAEGMELSPPPARPDDPPEGGPADGVGRYPPVTSVCHLVEAGGACFSEQTASSTELSVKGRGADGSHRGVNNIPLDEGKGGS